MHNALIDSHVHFDFFTTAERQELWQAAQAAGVGQMMIPAVARQYWQRIADICAEYGFIAAYGLHPVFLAEHQAADIAALADFVAQNPCLAIGECGLDYYLPLDKAAQQWFFEAQIEIALQYDLPLVLHARRSLEAVLQTLRRYPKARFVVHSFTGSDAQLDRLLSMGGYIGIGGTATYPRAQRLRKQLAQVCAERYFLETDAPDQPLCGYQGQANVPMRVAEVAAVLAELRGEAVEKISADSSRNFKRLFYKE